MIQMSLSLQGQRSSRFDAKARLPFKMAQGTVKRTIPKGTVVAHETSFQFWYECERVKPN